MGRIIFLLLLITRSFALSRELTSTLTRSTSCKGSCGKVVIPYPFGIGPGCYLNESYAVTCKDDAKPFLTSIDMELLEVSMFGYVRVKIPIFYSNCSIHNNKTSISRSFNISGSPFYFSGSENRLTAMGCNNFARLSSPVNNATISGCLSICNDEKEGSVVEDGCFGINCCEASFPNDIQSLTINLTTISDDNFKDPYGIGGGYCTYAFIVDKYWFENEASYGKNLMVNDDSKNVPAVLEWTGNPQGVCDLPKNSNTSCGHNDAWNYDYCWAVMDSTHLCFCYSNSVDRFSLTSWSSQTYISEGCQDSAECEDRSNYTCLFMCIYSPTSRNCTCPDGYKPRHDEDNSWCILQNTIIDKERHRSRLKAAIIGCTSGPGLLFLVSATWILYKQIKRRNELKCKQKFFKRNGGLLLQQQLSTSENNINKTKLFTSEELEKATNHYHVNRILGQGGQGTVYKGMLTDGQIVAVKRSRKVDEAKLGHFINEVTILLQINHRNVVKLLGCCLETEVPLLVYEFIPNGTLFQYLHDQNPEFPLTWDRRLRIATEVANALSYLHSAASMPIYHRDIKTSNILLDEKYRAKISDFGTSRSIAIDQTHLTTNVQGTFGYLDPEYFQSSQFTEKSDVYSFGVVLVELLTGQKPITLISSEEHRSLAAFFLLIMEENRLLEILDTRVVMEAEKEEIAIVAKLAQRCLNLHGKNRPSMKEVAKQLEGIKASQEVSSSKQDHEEVCYTSDDIIRAWDTSSSTNMSCLNTSTIRHEES